MRSILKYFKQRRKLLCFIFSDFEYWSLKFGRLTVLSIRQIKEIFDISPCLIFIPFCEGLYAKSTVTEREVDLQKFTSECTTLRSLFSEILNTQILQTFKVWRHLQSGRIWQWAIFKGKLYFGVAPKTSDQNVKILLSVQFQKSVSHITQCIW